MTILCQFFFFLSPSYTYDANYSGWAEHGSKYFFFFSLYSSYSSLSMTFIDKTKSQFADS